jgi:hypothetical protein
MVTLFGSKGVQHFWDYAGVMFQERGLVPFKPTKPLTPFFKEIEFSLGQLPSLL